MNVVFFLSRLPGRSILIKQLKETFDCGEGVEFVIPDVDIHSVGSLLKLYLRELPEPMIPNQFYEPVMKIVQRDMHLNPEKAMHSLEALLSHLPRNNYNLLQYLCQFLSEVSKKSDINKMTAMNLATVFVHSVIRPEDDDPALLMGTSNGRTQVTFIFITEHERLFTMEYNAQGAAVKVDTLLDIDASAMVDKVFNPNTDSTVKTQHMPSSSSPGDIFDLMLDGTANDSTLPSPMPVAIATPFETPTETNQGIAREEETDKTTEDTQQLLVDLDDMDPFASGNVGREDHVTLPHKPDPPTVPTRPAPLPPQIQKSEPPVPPHRPIVSTKSEPVVPQQVPDSGDERATQPDSISSSSPESFGNRPNKVQMRSKSAPKARPRNCYSSIVDRELNDGPPVPPPKPQSFTSTASSSDVKVLLPDQDRPVPARPAPPPPKKMLQSNKLSQDYLLNNELETAAQVVSRDSSTSLSENDNRESALPDNEKVESLLNTDVEDFSVNELKDFVASLKSELSHQRNLVLQLNSTVHEQNNKQKKQLMEMARKMDQEKAATADAVTRIMSLQNQLQGYNLKYGILE